MGSGSKTPVPFFRHDLGKPELDAVAEVLAGPILTTGETVAEFERQFAAYLGRRNALGVTSCTGAMHLSLIALGVKPGDEVITTPMTFIATATAIIEAGAKPVFVDCEADTGLLDADRVAAAVTSRTRAIIPIHLYGQMCDMRALRRVADSSRLKIVEDCAHALESSRDGVRAGELGETSCYSFFATKAITSGEGGAVVTDSAELQAQMKLLRTHGMDKTAADRHREGYQHWDMPVMGWKYNMDNIQAALLLPQMKRIASNLARRQALSDRYLAELSGIRGLRFPASRPGIVHARHLFPVWVPAARRDEVIAELAREGISVVVNYRAIHLLKYFAATLGHARGSFPNAERIGDETISLPLYPAMPAEHVDRVIAGLKKILG